MNAVLFQPPFLPFPASLPLFPWSCSLCPRHRRDQDRSRSPFPFPPESSPVLPAVSPCGRAVLISSEPAGFLSPAQGHDLADFSPFPSSQAVYHLNHPYKTGSGAPLPTFHRVSLSLTLVWSAALWGCAWRCRPPLLLLGQLLPADGTCFAPSLCTHVVPATFCQLNSMFLFASMPRAEFAA